ncbi:MAG: hypothetical protein R6V10_07665 [bacterium]
MDKDEKGNQAWKELERQVQGKHDYQVFENRAGKPPALCGISKP